MLIYLWKNENNIVSRNSHISNLGIYNLQFFHIKQVCISKLSQTIFKILFSLSDKDWINVI